MVGRGEGVFVGSGGDGHAVEEMADAAAVVCSVGLGRLSSSSVLRDGGLVNRGDSSETTMAPGGAGVREGGAKISSRRRACSSAWG